MASCMMSHMVMSRMVTSSVMHGDIVVSRQTHHYNTSRMYRGDRHYLTTIRDTCVTLIVCYFFDCLKNLTTKPEMSVCLFVCLLGCLQVDWHHPLKNIFLILQQDAGKSQGPNPTISDLVLYRETGILYPWRPTFYSVLGTFPCKNHFLSRMQSSRASQHLHMCVSDIPRFDLFTSNVHG